MANGTKGVPMIACCEPSLRHTFATEMLHQGVPLAEVSKRLGHADQNITLGI